MNGQTAGYVDAGPVIDEFSPKRSRGAGDVRRDIRHAPAALGQHGHIAVLLRS